MFRDLFRKRVYLDYAALTPIDPRVVREMAAYSTITYGNPSALYREGVAARAAVDGARASVAGFIHAHPDEIVFTSGGTEANALALEGAVRAARTSGIDRPHIVVSVVEHSSISETAEKLEVDGCDVSRISVDRSGIVDLDELEKAIGEHTVIVSIQMVNNETGVIQPIKEIAKIIRNARKRSGDPAEGPSRDGSTRSNYPLLHTDAAQALYQEISVEKLGIDLLTLDASKMYGPRGIGCLYVKRRTPIEPIIRGGGQERGFRSGTENVPAMMGFAKAVDILKIDLAHGGIDPACGGVERLKEGKIEGSRGGLHKGTVGRLQGLKDEMIEGLKKISPDIVVNGEGAVVSPHILNVSIPGMNPADGGIDNELFVLRLDAKGIACSTRSSCLRDEDESYVLRAMGVDGRASVRFSFGRWTTMKDIRRALAAVERSRF